MNLEQMKQRFNLSESEVKHLENYFEKAKTAEVMWCEPHDREYLDFETCPICEQEKKFFKQYMTFGLEDIEEIIRTILR